MFPSLLLVLLLAAPALLTPSTSQELQVRGHRTPRDTKQDSIKVVISEGCATQGDSSDVSQGGKEIDLSPGSPLVLTHKIKLVPSGSGSGSGSCGCETDFAALRERLERLEREVSALREKCGGADGGCCTSKESKGAGCSIKPEIGECPNECSDQGRCVDGKCVCFPGFSGPDCSESNCPGNCNDNGKCLNGQCVCDPGFTGPDCSQRGCPDNCNNRGRCVDGQCVNGKCVCDSGFTGPDCSETACPGNCNNRGRCINGECVCDDGFNGPDCSERTCPNDCYDRGRCVDGKCVCDSGFTGDDCSEISCPGNCNNRGRCVDGKCVCNDGFTGEDCSEKACPNNCSNRGKCVNGKCVCDVGFAGPDCAAKGCPNNCNNKGRCVKGKCVCRRGFTGPDCSQCEEGMTGPNCDTAMSGVSQLSTQDITETSVTLVWTPPPVQYDTYHITFTSQKEVDQQIIVQVEGSLTTFTQTGLAAGQEYSVSITGEIDGRRGAESTAEFTTLISGPTNLQVVKTTSTSAVVQWEQSQGEIDRYRLTVTPNDGAGRSQDVTVPSGQNSAHIQQLEAGHLYDIVLVAEKGTSRSEPATTQVTPGKTLPRVTTAALTTQVTLAPGQDVGDRDQESPEVQVLDQQGRREDRSEADSVKVGGIDRPNKDSTATVIARTKPVVSRKTVIDGTRPKPTLSKKPNVPGRLRFNTTRDVPGVRKVGPGPLKKIPVGVKKNKIPIVPKKPKPGVPNIGNRTKPLTVRDPSVQAPGTERTDAKNPAIMSGTDSETNRQSSLEEPTIPVGSKEQPDVGMAGHGKDTAPVSSEPIGTVQSQEKKCMNKVKVTHIRLPLKDRGSGCRGDGTVLGGKTPGSHSSETDDTPDLKPSSAQTDLDYAPDPLHKLLKNTFDYMNITTFSVHLSQSSDLDSDSESVTNLILGGLKPLSSFSSSSTSQSSSESSSSQLSAAPSSSLPSSPSSLPSLVSSSSTDAPSSSLTHLVSTSPSLLPSLLSPSPPSSLSSSDNSGPVGSNEPDVDSSKSTTDVASPEDRKLPPPGKGVIPFFRRTPSKSGYIRRPRPNFGSFRNKTHLNLRVPHHSNPNLNLTPGGETGTRNTSTSEISSSPSSSASEESSSVEVNVPTNGHQDGTTTSASSEVEQNEKKMPTERGKVPVRRIPLKGGYLRRPLPNIGPLQNRTRPNSRLLPPPSKTLNPASDTRKEQISPSELPATLSPPVFKESYPAEGIQAIEEKDEDRVGTSMSKEFNHTSGVPSFHRPNAKVGVFRRPQLYGGRFQNKSRTNFRPPQRPYRGPIRGPLPTRKINGGINITGSQTNQFKKVSTPGMSDIQSRDQGDPMPTQGDQIKQPGEQNTAEVIPSAQLYGHDTPIRSQTNELDREDNDPVQTTKSGVEGSGITVGSQTSPLEKVSTPEIPDNQSGEKDAPVPTQVVQSGEQDAPLPTQGVQLRQSGEQDTAGVIPSALTDGDDTPIRSQINELERGDNAPVQTTKPGVEETRTPDSNSDSDIHKERANAAKNPAATSRRRPTIKQTSPAARQGAPRPDTLPSARIYGHDTTITPQTKELEVEDNDPTRDTKSGVEETRTPDSISDSDIHKERVNIGKHTGAVSRGRPTMKQTSSDARHGAPRPGTLPSARMDGDDTTIRPQTDEMERGDNAPDQTNKSGEEETRTPDSTSDIHRERVNVGKNTGAISRGRPTMKQNFSSSRPGAPRPVTPPKRQPPQRGTHMRPYMSGSQRREDTKTNNTAKRLFGKKTGQTGSPDSKPLMGSGGSSSGVTREPLDYVGVTNRTRDGFTLTWDSPEGKYKNFVVTRTKVEKEKDGGPKQKESRNEEDEENHQTTKETQSQNGGREDENKVPESVPRIQSSTTAKPVTGSDKTFKKVIPGSARSFPFENLLPQTDYTVTLLGKSPGLLSKLHKLVISTGPEPPTNIVFSKVTENSVTVSWTKPKSPISGFKVTYTHTEDGEPVSVSVDSDDSTVGLSQLSPGSSYEVSVISILGLDESDPIKDFVMTLPDPPTDLRAVNVTDTKALLLWRPALAAIDKYAIVYSSEKGPELKVTVSGNAAEQQLSDLEGSTTYTVTITSLLGSTESTPATTTFTTTGGSGGANGPRDLQATNVTPRSALLSWKPPSNPVGSYRLTYQTEDQEMQEVIVAASVTEYNLTRLHPGSKYTVQLQAEEGGRYTSAISTDLTTGTLRFPFPNDCSQELLNGIRTSGVAEVFPQGKDGKPINVYCDMETDGGGWTVFQRRKDGLVDFFRGWKEYLKGFGDLSGEFWLGLESLHNLTSMTRMSLRIDLRDKDESVFAKYSTFEVAKRNYRLTVGGYSGTAGDSLSYHNNRVFSTKDRDPAPFITRCAMSYRGGWWYKNCHEANLNGLYGIDVKHQGVIWTSWKGKEFSIPFTEMKMRPAAFSPPTRG
ncbi:uncharacterized protein tnxbb [Symphorus nematophorus]